MTKGQLIDIVINKVSGGKPTDDLMILGVDVAIYIAPAINFAVTKNYYLSKNEGFGEINGAYLATTVATVQKDTVRDLDFIDLPNLLPLAVNRGVRHVGNLKGTLQGVWTRQSSRLHDSFYNGTTRDTFEMFLEGTRVYLRDLSSPTVELLVQYVQSMVDLGDDDRLNIPAGQELDIINIIVEFFTGQRALPEDNLVDQADGINTN